MWQVLFFLKKQIFIQKNNILLYIMMIKIMMLNAATHIYEYFTL